MSDKDQHYPESKIDRRNMLTGAGAIAAGLGAAVAAQNAVGAESAGGEEPASFQLKDLTQVAFVVKDIEASSKKFADLFGAKPPNIIITDPVEKANTRYHGKPTKARAKLAFFRFGQVSFELIEPIGGPSTWKEALDKNGESVHHVAFKVEDMDKACAALKEKGYETIQTGDFTGGCYAYVDTVAAIGTVIELLASKT